MRASSCASREGGLRGANIHLPSSSSLLPLLKSQQPRSSPCFMSTSRRSSSSGGGKAKREKSCEEETKWVFFFFFSISTSGYFRGAETKTKICLSVFPNGICLSRGENILRTFLLLFLAAETARNHKDNLPHAILYNKSLVYGWRVTTRARSDGPCMDCAQLSPPGREALIWGAKNERGDNEKKKYL